MQSYKTKKIYIKNIIPKNKNLKYNKKNNKIKN